MKKRTKIFLGIAALAVVAAIALQMVLTRHLTGILRAQALPDLERSLGANLELDSAAVHLFRGAVEARGFRIMSPPGAPEPTVLSLGRGSARLSLLSLLGGVVRVRNLSAENLVMTVAWDGNAEKTAGAVERILGAMAQSADTATNAPAGTKPQRVRVDRVRIQTRVRFIDYTRPDDIQRAELDLQITGADLATYDAGQPDGQFDMRGHLAGQPDACVVHLRGTTGPLTGAPPDFTAEGSIENVDLALLREFSSKTGVEGDSASVAVKVICHEGQYQGGSVLTFRVQNAKLTGKRAKKAHGLQIPPDFTLSVPVSGPLNKPELDFTTGLLQSVLSGFASPGGDGDDSLEKEVGSAFKLLKGALKSQK